MYLVIVNVFSGFGTWAKKRRQGEIDGYGYDAG
jgi:hypothetical protein